MSKQQYDIDIICEITDMSAYKLAEQFATLTLSDAGKKYNPFNVHFCTTPSADNNEFTALTQRNDEGCHGLVTKIEKEHAHEGQPAVDRLFERLGDSGRKLLEMENVTVNSNDLEHGPDFRHIAVIFCDNRGKLPIRVMSTLQRAKKGAAKNAPEHIKTGGGEIPIFDSATFDHKYIGVVTKTKNIVKYTNYILVPKTGPTAKLPHPNRMRESVRVWVQNPEQLRELTQKCTPCGGELQYLLCDTCAKQYVKLHKCAKCNTILVKNEGDSSSNAVYHCEKAKCDAEAIRVSDMKPENRNLWGCSRCKKFVEKPAFNASVEAMRCIACKESEPHEHVFYVGQDFSVFTDSNKAENGAKILKEYKEAWNLGARRRDELARRSAMLSEGKLYDG